MKILWTYHVSKHIPHLTAIHLPLAIQFIRSLAYIMTIMKSLQEKCSQEKLMKGSIALEGTKNFQTKSRAKAKNLCGAFYM